jgi:hypothetical protein
MAREARHTAAFSAARAMGRPPAQQAAVARMMTIGGMTVHLAHGGV